MLELQRDHETVLNIIVKLSQYQPDTERYATSHCSLRNCEQVLRCGKSRRTAGSERSGYLMSWHTRWPLDDRHISVPLFLSTSHVHLSLVTLVWQVTQAADLSLCLLSITWAVPECREHATNEWSSMATKFERRSPSKLVSAIFCTHCSVVRSTSDKLFSRLPCTRRSAEALFGCISTQHLAS